MRLLSIGLVLASVLWAAAVVRQALEADHGGPALGALCMAAPAVLMLIGAGAAWPKGDRRERGSHTQK